MNELLDKLAELDKLMVTKLCGMKDKNYLDAVEKARHLITDASSMIARANGK